MRPHWMHPAKGNEKSIKNARINIIFLNFTFWIGTDQSAKQGQNTN
jgi:hypothetical protein